MKKVFTTGQVAKICKVAPRTVSKWFDSGRLRGYRIPGSQDRRIPREHLIRFLKEHGMPLGDLEEEGWHKILVVGAEQLFIDRVQSCCPRTTTTGTRSPPAASRPASRPRASTPTPSSSTWPWAAARRLQIAQNLRRNPDYEATLIIALASEDEAAPEGLAIRLQRRLQEAVRRRPARRADPHARRRETRQHVRLFGSSDAACVSCPIHPSRNASCDTATSPKPLTSGTSSQRRPALDWFLVALFLGL